MVRIIFVINSFRVGGAETQLISLIREIKKTTSYIEVISLFPREELAGQIEEEGVKVHYLNMSSLKDFPFALFKAGKIIRAYRPDIVHSHMFHSNIFSRVLKPFVQNSALINTAHNSVEGGKIRYLIYRLTSPVVAYVSVISRDGEKRHLSTKATNRKKLGYIPNGIDTETFRPDEQIRKSKRAELDLKDEFFFLSVGALSEQKNFSNLLHAIYLLKKQGYSRVRLMVAGKAPVGSDNDNKLKEIVNELDLENYVTFLGLRNDVHDLMRATDGYVSSSSWEGMPIVLLEAAASALPVVATDVGDSREIVHENKNGYLVPPKDSQSLSDAMRKLVDQPESSLNEMAKYSRKNVIEKFSIENIASEWLNIYKHFSGKIK